MFIFIKPLLSLTKLFSQTNLQDNDAVASFVNHQGGYGHPEVENLLYTVASEAVVVVVVVVVVVNVL